MRALLVFFLTLPACATSDCLTSCQKIWGDQSGQCNLQDESILSDADRQDQINSCKSSCQTALARYGDLGGYEPNQKRQQSDTVCLENEQQAAVWIDCVTATACEDLQSNWCAPVYPTGECLN